MTPIIQLVVSTSSFSLSLIDLNIRKCVDDNDDGDDGVFIAKYILCKYRNNVCVYVYVCVYMCVCVYVCGMVGSVTALRDPTHFCLLIV